MAEVIQSQPIDIPAFLKDPELTKPESDEARNKRRLLELVDGMDKEDAMSLCTGLASKYPIEMFTALVNRTNDLMNFYDNIERSLCEYTDKRNSYV